MKDSNHVSQDKSGDPILLKVCELPIACPNSHTPPLWNMHPRVMLPLSKVGDVATCPYCGTRYKVTE